LAGLGHRAETLDDLREWDYGEFEGLKTAEIRVRHPDWDLFRDGCPGGESVDQIGGRADGVIARLRQAPGDAIVFAHGHILRVLTARWLGLSAADGRLFLCEPTSLGILGYEHDHQEEPVVRLWNDTTG
jgi:probable phosphoglycerate mutase